jgi:hypothetical protein
MARGSVPEPTGETISLPTESLFVVDEHGGGLTIGGEYDPGITKEVDKKIRHLPVVVQHINLKAHELLKSVGTDNFEVVLSNKPSNQRPRAYVVPSNDDGIHEELSQAVLLKAALGMAGK